jgi:predicted ATPase/DNA-binding SARP family transcriptional activator
MSHLALYTLGSLRFELDGKEVDIGRRKAAALLVYLLVNGQRQRRDRLAALFWPDLPQESAYAQLRQALWEIRRSVGEERLAADREEIGPNPGGDVWLDVEAFRKQLGGCGGHGSSRMAVCSCCIPALGEAADLYRGDFLEGFGLSDSASFDDWQFFEREALRAEYAGVLERLAHACLGDGDTAAAIEYTRRWLSLDPLNEIPRRKLMEAYASSGQRSAALRQYQECVRLLEQELGVEPEEATTRLYQRIQAGELEPRAAPQPVLVQATLEPQPQEDKLPVTPVQAAPRPLPPSTRPPIRPRHNLPAQPTPFVGRRDELDEIATRLADPGCRLLTLLGPGGVGKTRLALQAAREALPAFPQGVYFIPLAAVQSAEAILPTMAVALDFTFLKDGLPVQDQLFNFLREKRLLLVLDNFEHLVEAASLVVELLEAAPQIKLLITSRQHLSLHSEWVMEVLGMRHPPSDTVLPEPVTNYSAVQLFLQAAQRLQPGFTLAEADIPFMVRLTQLVQGTPLALELAAAWVGVLSLPEIVAEIERNLDFLSSEMQDLPERQRSLRAVFEHSWNLLSEAEQRSYTRLSVFCGGFTRQAAQAVAGVNPRELMGLVGKSLLHRNPSGRFDLHELLRQYAAEMLAQDGSAQSAVFQAHAIYYTQAVERWGEALRGWEQQQASAEMGSEMCNLRSAWEWAARQGNVPLLRQAFQGWMIYYMRQFRADEARLLFRTACSSLPSPTTLEERRMRALLLLAESGFGIRMGYDEADRQRILEAQALLQDPDLPSPSLEEAFLYTLLARWNGAYEDGQQFRPLAEHSLALFNALGEGWWASEVMFLLQNSYHWRAIDDELYQLHRNLVKIKRDFGDRLGMANVLSGMGKILTFGPGRFAEAEQLFEQSNEILQAFNDSTSLALAQDNQDQILTMRGDFPTLLELRKVQLATLQDLGDQRSIGLLLAQIGETYHMLGDYEQAEAYCRRGVAMLQASTSFNADFARWFLGLTLISAGKVAEAEEVLQECIVSYRRMYNTLGEAAALAGLARLALGRGDLARGEEMARQGLGYLLQDRHYFWALYVLADYALLFALRGEIERAVELYSMLEVMPFVGNSAWFTQLFGLPIYAAAQNLPSEIATAARQRGQARDVWEVAGELSTLKRLIPGSSDNPPLPPQ